MTVGHVVQYYIESLSKIYDEGEAKAITHFVMEEVLNLTHAELILNSKQTISEIKANQLAYYLVRLLKHEPVQYVLNVAYFSGLKFFVNKEVLIPRPETEELVEWIDDEYRNYEQLKILDIGTGSGCIAIAIKKKMPQAEIYAMDISSQAIDIAGKNARQNNVEIHFFQDDILNPKSTIRLPQFDIVVSNPPYITRSEKPSLKNNVLFEPEEALFVDDEDPLIFYRQFLSTQMISLEKNGTFYFEMNPSYARQLQEWAQQKGFSITELRKDLTGNNRMLKISR